MTSTLQSLGGLLAHPPSTTAMVRRDLIWTWAQVAALAGTLDRLLNGVALSSGSRIGVVLENRPHLAACSAALLASDRCLTILSPLRGVESLRNDIEAAGPPIVVASSRTLALPGVRHAITRQGRAIAVDWDGSCGMEAAEPVLPTDRPEAPGMAVEMPTGEPRRQVQITYRQFLTALWSASAPEYGAGTTIISTPIEQIDALRSLVATMLAGRRTVLLEQFSVDEWIDTVERYKPRTVSLTAAALQTVVDADVAAGRLASLRVIVCGPGPCAPQLVDALLARYGIRVLPTYGATEYSGAIAGWTSAEHGRWWGSKRGAVGRALPGVNLRIVGEGGQEVPNGSPGVLEIRSAQAVNGGRQWVRTEDSARLDQQGFLWIERRVDDPRTASS